MHRWDPAGPLPGRAGHKGLAPSGHAHVCKSQEVRASHAEGCWVPASPVGPGHQGWATFPTLGVLTRPPRSCWPPVPRPCSLPAVFSHP